MVNTRHKNVVQNIIRLTRRQEYSKDGVIILQFGTYHLGLERYVQEELKKKGIPVRVAKPEPFGRNPSIWEEIVEKRARNPRFVPTDEDIARATLHSWIALGNSIETVQKTEAMIRKMSIEKIKQALAAYMQQDGQAVNALLSEGRKKKER